MRTPLLAALFAIAVAAPLTALATGDGTLKGDPARGTASAGQPAALATPAWSVAPTAPRTRTASGERLRKSVAGTPPSVGQRAALEFGNAIERVRSERRQQLAARAAGADLAPTRATPRVALDPNTGAARFIRGDVGEAPRAPVQRKADGRIDPVAIAHDYLWRARAVTRVADPEGELSVSAVRTDARGEHHVRFQQRSGGVPIFGREVQVHLRADGTPYLFQGTQRPSGAHPTTPRLGLDAARAKVLAARGAGARVEHAELTLWAPEGGALKLAWRVVAYGADLTRWTYFVDARRSPARVLHVIDDTHTAGSLVTASGNDLLGQNRSFTAWLENGTYYAIDPSTPLTNPSYAPLTNGPNARGDTFLYDANEGDGDDLTIPTSNAQNSGWDAAAVTARHNTKVVYDFYKVNFGRDSIDGNGMNLFTVIHFDQDYDNAFWNGQYMVYGDGGTAFHPLVRCLDVAAHEMTHGVVEHTAGLVYEFQPGALNESFADVMGAMVDDGDWKMGEDCTKAAPGWLRNLESPNNAAFGGQPAHMSQYQNLSSSQDNGGVHVNSGIPNRVAYLFTEGLPNAVGRAVARQVYYRALSEYLLATSNFLDARRALIQSAEDLYPGTPAVATAMADAWDAVGLSDSGGGTAPDPTPTPTDPVSGDDLLAYLYPVDGSYDSAAEGFQLWVQDVTGFAGYDAQKDFGPLNALRAARWTRPSAYTDATGSYVAYVGTDFNIYLIAPDGSDNQLTGDGVYWSVAFSPDGSRAAYTSVFAEDNNIHVLDFDAGTVVSIPISSPDYQQGGGTPNSIFFADSLAFDFSGRKLVFDALSCQPLPGGSCPDAGVYYYQVGVLDVGAERASYPFPGQDPSFDLGFPTFAYNNDYTIAFSVVDNGLVGHVAGYTYVFDLSRTVATGAFTNSDTVGSGVWTYSTPTFWGDDAYLAFQMPDGTPNVGTTGRVAFDPGFVPDLPSFQRLNPFASALPTAHRAAVRVLDGGLEVTPGSVSFGAVAAGQSASAALTLTNTANHDINLRSVTLGDGYAADLANGLVPQGQSVDFELAFAPEAAGAYAGSLTLAHDGVAGSTVVPVSGTGTATGDLALSVADPPTALGAGNTVRFDFTVASDAEVDAIGVAVTGQRPANTTFVSGAFGGVPCAQSGTTITCPGATVAAEGFTTGNVTLAPTRAGALALALDVSGPLTDATGANDADGGAVDLPADLRATGTLPTKKKHKGDKLKFTVALTNLGALAAPGVTLVMPIPTGANHSAATINGGSCVNLNRVVTCSLASLAGGATATAVFTVKATKATTLNFAATADSTATDPVSSNDVATGSKRIYK